MIIYALRFFPRQLRDMLFTRGAAMLVIVAVLVLPVLLIDFAARPGEVDWKAILSSNLGDMTLFLTMVATYGIIGEDVRRGYFRFLFCKPISPLWYYVQAFVAAWIAFFAVQLVVIGIFAVAREPVWPGQALVRSWGEFLLLGAIIFGLSRITRLDWLLGILLVVLGPILRTAYPASESLRGKLINAVMPPSHLFDRQLFPEGLAWPQVAWLLGYAGLALALGLFLVRAIPFGTERT
jgi:hypothetical protein